MFAISKQTIVAASLITVLSAACAAPAAAPATQPATPLKLGVLPFLSNSIFAIADKEGYFAEQGLAVELVPLKSDNDAIPMLVKGELDIATPALTAGLFNAIAESGKIKMALGLTSYTPQDCASIGMLVRRADKEAGKFAAPGQWKGARVTLPPAGVQSMNGFVLERALKQGDLALSDVTFVKADLPAQGAALASGQTDMVYAVEPWVTRMLDGGELALLMPLEPVMPGLTASQISFGAKILAEPALGERFAKAYLKAVRQYAKGKTARNVELVAAYTKLDPQLVQKLCWPVVSPNGGVNVDVLMEYQSWMKAQNLVDRVLPADDVVDARFVDAALRDLGKVQP